MYVCTQSEPEVVGYYGAGAIQILIETMLLTRLFVILTVYYSSGHTDKRKMAAALCYLGIQGLKMSSNSAQHELLNDTYILDTLAMKTEN